MIGEALKTGSGVEFEETFVDKNGNSKYSIKGVSPILHDNELSGLVGYSFDITEIKEAQRKMKEYAEELERKNGELHHFVNATSHDLKSPLRNIASHLQLLLRRNAGKLDQESVGLVAYTIKSVKQLNQLISDIYQYSIADRNDKPLEMADLNALLEASLKQMEDVITSKGAEITYNPLPILKMAPAHIGMLFSNLVGNALKYNAALRPRVMISATASETEHIISIADNGIGIATEYQEQIFQIFQRLHTSSEYEGTGVGLAICSKIVDNYGGRIWVESLPGKGSTFYFSFEKEMVDPVVSENHNITAFKSIAKAG
jgi:light-regulated signal transduction histidine kinase (bacteriophytochrome)